MAPRNSIDPVEDLASTSAKRKRLPTPLMDGFVWLLLVVSSLARTAHGQQARYTWQQIRDMFESSNPTLLAAKLNVDELRAQEITAHLRPNPDFTLSADGTQIAPSKGVWQPFAGTFVSPGISYL